MAGILNAVYLIVAVAVGVIGLAAVTTLVSDSNSDSRLVELSSIVVAVVFLLALGVEFMA